MHCSKMFQSTSVNQASSLREVLEQLALHYMKYAEDVPLIRHEYHDLAAFNTLQSWRSTIRIGDGGVVVTGE
jgi:hypothetical protein